MEAPIADFVRHYAESGAARFHMPGHKGRGPLGCEGLDITEVSGADALYEAEGIIARSEENARRLFGSAATRYSTEGSSQCIRAMVALVAMAARARGRRPVLLAGRNAHKTLVLAAGALDCQIRWLWPEGDFSLCRCPVSPAALSAALDGPEPLPDAVYLTAPDYLGGTVDLSALSAVCRSRGVPLLVDNAHGAYLKFLSPSRHPLDLGADACCDSAHKTLPVLTGGAYLHIGRGAPPAWAESARQALALFGSTSPSYLTLQSLDLCNGALSGDLPAQMAACAARLEGLRRRLRAKGWAVADSDPLKLTIQAADSGWNGADLAQALRAGGVEGEYADPEHWVAMITPCNLSSDLDKLESLLTGLAPRAPRPRPRLTLAPPAVACSIREALLSPRETVPAEAAQGRVLAAPTVACPPAVPVVVSGEIIPAQALPIFRYYGIRQVSVLK